MRQMFDFILFLLGHTSQSLTSWRSGTSTVWSTTWWRRSWSLLEDSFGPARITMETCSQTFWLRVSALPFDDWSAVALLVHFRPHSHNDTLFTSELRLVYLYLWVQITLWCQVCLCLCVLCVVSRFWFSGSHDISSDLPWRKDSGGRGCPWHRHQALPGTPEGKNHQATLLSVF